MTKEDIIRMANEAGYTREKLQQLVGAYAELYSDLMVEYLKLHEQNKRLRERLAILAQPEQREWVGQTDSGHTFILASELARLQRQPLTDREIGKCIDEVNAKSEYGHHHFGWHLQLIRAAEAILKDKNT
jgi:hypothetical protein